jgi:Protein of unknown function (DUF2795)
VIEKSRWYRVAAGVYSEDITRFDQALRGLRYPAEKWQLIAHAVQARADQDPADLRTIEQLWALPAGRYANFSQVLAGAARTARGHPRRPETDPKPDQEPAR